ncbi:MAG: hypothetical protein EA397_04175 [Deltaproteobacteria bacterium]|nr:MAG: hypothetical protein EA397_04175 [Deltaproteobacteria bacterium]
MKDVTFRPQTLREATAQVLVRLDAPTLTLVAEGRVSKGDVLEASRLAAIMAVKKTPDILPFCHPLPVGGIDARAELVAEGIQLTLTVRGIANTGFEMEALAGAAVGALNVYDMLKPHSQAVFMEGAQLVQKQGGTAQWRETFAPPLVAVVLPFGDVTAQTSTRLRDRLAQTDGVRATILPPIAPSQGVARLRAAIAEGAELILTLGGLDLRGSSGAYEAVTELIDVELPGVIDAARAYLQRRTPRGMLLRGTCGRAGDTLIATFPGNPSQADDCGQALLPPLLHAVHAIRASPSRA